VLVFMVPRVRLSAALVGALGACATVDEAPAAPGLQVAKDDYDGATIVRQAPVAAGMPGEGDFNALGFEWRSKFPNRVVLVAGTRGVIRVANLVVEVDGTPLPAKVASETTEYGDPGAGERWSMRRFEVAWDDFERIAAGRTVRLKVVGPNEMFGTSFGSDHAGAPVNRTLATFRATVRRLRGEPD
jgi:hypothetical protein